ncbi:hypothetical protein [Anaplasma bovis]|uniref:hypothetical protein n=1 Tax=Anaplasma bovis TaxID=186733 RepID=UPI002FF1F7AF
MQQVPEESAVNANPQKLLWEVSRHQKYSNGCLSHVSCLYSIEVCSIKGMLTFSVEPIKKILLRINLSVDCVLLNKAVGIEILCGVSFIKFTSKKKSYNARMLDLSKYLETNLGIVLPDSIKKSFAEEFDEAAKLLKSSFSM